MTANHLIPLPKQNGGILKQIRDTKKKLIEGLAKSETPTGWQDPSEEAAQSVWSAIEVLYSLVESGEIPTHFVSIYQRIVNAEKEVNVLSGWEYEGMPNHISVHVTVDGIKLYFALKQLNDLKRVLQSLQKMQNKDDGGWGVCDGDKISKVRSTSRVLTVLIMCMNFPMTEDLVDKVVVVKGLNWLYNAQNDTEGDYGWGNVSNTLPSNTSSTLSALETLVEAAQYSISHKSNVLPVRVASIKRGLEQIIATHANPEIRWQSAREDFGINLEGEIIGRHVIAGGGTTLAAQVLIKACALGYLDPSHESIYYSIGELIRRCKSYRHVNVLVPADDAGTPVVWNSAFALDAFNMFERLYVQKIGGSYLEPLIYKALLKRAKWWQRISAILCITIIVIFLLPYINALAQIPRGFSGLPTLYQGIIMIFLGIAIEQIIEQVYRFFKARVGFFQNKAQDKEGE